MEKTQKVLLKLSGEALSGEAGKSFSEKNVLEVARQVKELVAKGIQVGIVIGGGNFWRGRTSENMDRTKADQIGMLATVMNCLYAAEVFRTLDLKTLVMTPFKVGQMTVEFDKDLCMEKQEEGVVTFFAPFAMPLKQIAKRFLLRMGKTTPIVSPPNFAFTSVAISSVVA